MASIISSLTTTQIQALTTAEIASLSTADINALYSSQIQALTTSQVAALKATQAAVLDATDIANLSNVTSLSAAGIAALSTAAVAALASTSVGALSTAQIGALTTAQVNALTAGDFTALTTSQVAALKATQAAVIDATDIATLSNVTSLSAAGIAALSTAAVAALASTSVGALSTAQIAALTTAQIIALSTNDITALSTSQLVALTGSQQMALTVPQVTAVGANVSYLTKLFSSPLILDLNGDGITTQGIAAGTKFDLNATGETVSTGWVSGGDGLLVIDRNHDGVINDGGELFGTSTLLSNGQKAANGYAALNAMDTNADGLISSADAGWADLKIWVDGNSDGVTQAGEMRTLDSLGITKLDLSATTSPTMNNGNLVGMISNYQTTDGTQHEMADVWFAINQNQSANAAVTPPVVVAGDLASRVSGMSQMIASFNESLSGAPSSSGTPRIDSPPNTATVVGVAGMAVNVGGMADALKQFDQNGNLVGVSTIVQSVPTVPALTPIPNSASSGILASGK